MPASRELLPPTEVLSVDEAYRCLLYRAFARTPRGEGLAASVVLLCLHLDPAVTVVSVRCLADAVEMTAISRTAGVPARLVVQIPLARPMTPADVLRRVQLDVGLLTAVRDVRRDQAPAGGQPR